MIKVVIFDFDGTIYLGDVGNKNKSHDKFIVKTALGDGVYEELDNKYGVSKKDMKYIVEVCKNENLDFKKVAETFENTLFIHKIQDFIEILPNSFFKELSKKCSIYVVSMSPAKYLQHYFSLYDIDKTCFKGIFSLDILKDNSKAVLYNKIARMENCQHDEILVVGDNFLSDIKPAIDEHFETLHLNEDFNMLYSYFENNNILNCEAFKNEHKLKKQ